MESVKAARRQMQAALDVDDFHAWIMARVDYAAAVQNFKLSKGN